MKRPRDGHWEGKEGGNLSGRKTHAQSGAQALGSLGQTGQGGREPSRPQAHGAPGAPGSRPPAGAGAELRAGPGRHMRWNPRLHPPCSAAGAQQRAGRPFSPAAPRPRPPDFTSTSTSKRRGPPESSRLGGLGPAATWPLALPWRAGPEEAKMSSAPTLHSSLLHPQSPSYSRYSIHA